MVDFLEKHKKALNILEDIVLVVLFASLILLLFSAILGYSPFYYVEGISMHPTIENGDLIIIDWTRFEDLKVGDIIVFKRPLLDDKVVHRIVDVRNINGERVFITKGDNNQVPDSNYVKSDNYVGKYVGIRIPYAGFIGQALAPPVNYAIIAILVIYLIYLDIYQPKKRAG
ncbi:MAG: signal peptidase I [Nitrososphaeria archaeon]